MKDSGYNLSIRGLLALLVVLGLAYLVLTFSGRLYYGPLCQRYADSRGITYISYTGGSVKHDRPAECFFRDANGNTSRILVSTIEPTLEDWVRWLVSWVTVIVGIGGSVWLASVVGGVKVKRRRR